jgi:SAM-dependent methyltransferase
MGERERWNGLANAHPYWAVVNDPRFRADRIQTADVAAFFDSGEREIADTFARVRRIAGSDFRPRSAVDFGCGLGRLTLPIARSSDRVLAIDVSETMLAAIRANCESRGIANVDTAQTDEFLAVDDRGYAFDFVHSFIVFQHIPPAVGLAITDRLLARLSTGGVAALQYTYARRASSLRRLVHRLRRGSRVVNAVGNAVKRRPLLEPMIPMYEYDVGRLYEVFRQNDCHTIHTELTDHGGHVGAWFLFRKGE